MMNLNMFSPPPPPTPSFDTDGGYKKGGRGRYEDKTEKEFQEEIDKNNAEFEMYVAAYLAYKNLN